MSITSSSMLVELNLSFWKGSKLDKGASDDVTANAGATRNAAQVRKNLMAGTNMCKDISDFAASCHNWHRIKTLPWADRGCRLLPTSLFFDYKTEINQRRDTFNGLVDKFLGNYQNLIYHAQSELGSLFNASDYPTEEELRDKFGFRLTFLPVPEAGDFRVDVPASELDELKTAYEASFTGRLGEAMSDAWTRLHTVLTAMSEKMTEPEGETEKKTIYHKTLLSNTHDLCELLTHLNITGDPALEKARQQLEQAVKGIDIDDVRDSPAIRADIKGRVDSILKAYVW